MIENELKEYLKSLGATLVGFADLSKIEKEILDNDKSFNMKYGIAVAVKMDAGVIEGIKDGPTLEYYEEYNKVNKILDNITSACVEYIENKGYNAIGQTSTYVTSDNNLTTSLPHKTVATRAGLG